MPSEPGDAAHIASFRLAFLHGGQDETGNAPALLRQLLFPGSFSAAGAVPAPAVQVRGAAWPSVPPAGWPPSQSAWRGAEAGRTGEDGLAAARPAPAASSPPAAASRAAAAAIAAAASPLHPSPHAVGPDEEGERIDENDGEHYTHASFREEYGVSDGDVRWARSEVWVPEPEPEKNVAATFSRRLLLGSAIRVAADDTAAQAGPQLDPAALEEMVSKQLKTLCKQRGAKVVHRHSLSVTQQWKAEGVAEAEAEGAASMAPDMPAQAPPGKRAASNTARDYAEVTARAEPTARAVAPAVAVGNAAALAAAKERALAAAAELVSTQREAPASTQPKEATAEVAQPAASRAGGAAPPARARPASEAERPPPSAAPPPRSASSSSTSWKPEVGAAVLVGGDGSLRGATVAVTAVDADGDIYIRTSGGRRAVVSVAELSPAPAAAPAASDSSPAAAPAAAPTPASPAAAATTTTAAAAAVPSSPATAASDSAELAELVSRFARAATAACAGSPAAAAAAATVAADGSSPAPSASDHRPPKPAAVSPDAAAAADAPAPSPPVAACATALSGWPAGARAAAAALGVGADEAAVAQCRALLDEEEAEVEGAGLAAGDGSRPELRLSPRALQPLLRLAAGPAAAAAAAERHDGGAAAAPSPDDCVTAAWSVGLLRGSVRRGSDGNLVAHVEQVEPCGPQGRGSDAAADAAPAVAIAEALRRCTPDGADADADDIVGWAFCNPGWGVYAPQDALNALAEHSAALEPAAGGRWGEEAAWRLLLSVDALKSSAAAPCASAHRYEEGCGARSVGVVFEVSLAEV